jgi:hypothetical protein
MNLPQIKKNGLILLVSLIGLTLINYEALIEAFHGDYFVYEHDAYMHLYLALDAIKHHYWYAHINPLINAPYGADTHAWTQATMIFILAGTYVFNLVLPLKEALFWWCFFLPPLSALCSIFALLWAAKPLKMNKYYDWFIVLAFLLSPFIYQVYLPLRVDYDFLLVTTSIFYWGCLVRLVNQSSNLWAGLTALAAAFGIWVSMSFSLPLLIGLGLLFWFSLVSRTLASECVSLFLLVLCSAIALIIPIEHSNFMAISYDVLSIVYLSFYCLVLLCYLIYCRFKTTTLGYNCLLAVLLSLCLFALMNHWFPGFYRGPYNQANEFLLKNFFPYITEFYSPFMMDDNMALAMFFYAFIGATYFYHTYLNQELRAPHIVLLVPAVILTLLSLYMYRWVRIATPLSLVLVSYFLTDFCAIKKIHTLVKGLIIVLILLLPAGLFWGERQFISESELTCQQQFIGMLKTKFLDSPVFLKDKILFTTTNYGPFILYFTHFAVVGTNDHHNAQGYEDTYNFFKADEATARAVVEKRGIDLVLLCKSGHKTTFNISKTGWLEPVSLPERYSLWELYRFRH